MCSRYRTEDDLTTVIGKYGATQLPSPTNWNTPKDVYPSRPGVIVFNLENQLLVDSSYWSLQFRFRKNPEITAKYHTHNARIETITEKPTYKYPWADGYRCIIPAKHFVEWTGEKGSKTPLAIRPKDVELFHIAGIFDFSKYMMRGKEFISTSFTMLTCEPNDQMRKIHDRMPVIIEDWKTWLDPNVTPEQAMQMCVPYAGVLQAASIKKSG